MTLDTVLQRVTDVYPLCQSLYDANGPLSPPTNFAWWQGDETATEGLGNKLENTMHWSFYERSAANEFGLEWRFLQSLIERPTAEFTAALPVYLHIVGTTGASTVDYYRYQMNFNLEQAKIELTLSADQADGATISSA